MHAFRERMSNFVYILREVAEPHQDSDKNEKALDFLAKQSRVENRSVDDQHKYCIIWFQYASFIFDNLRTEEIALSSRLRWTIENDGQRYYTDSYWFDVVYQCHKLASQCINKVKKDCSDEFQSDKVGKQMLITNTILIRDVIALMQKCIDIPMNYCRQEFNKHMEETCNTFKNRLATLRLLGCWMTAVYRIFHQDPSNKRLEEAANRFYTCEQIIARFVSDGTDVPFHRQLEKDCKMNKHVSLAMYYHSKAQYSDAVAEYEHAIEYGYPETESIKKLKSDSERLGPDKRQSLWLKEIREVMSDGKLTGTNFGTELELEFSLSSSAKAERL